MINITKPTTLTFTPEVISFILDSLAERPFKLANPIIQDIFNQLRMQESIEVQKAVASQEDKIKEIQANGEMSVQ